MGIKERKEREKEARREEILNAAEKVFFEKGLAAATMDEIAELAELSKGTIYLYYKCKEDLYVAASLRGWDIMERLFREATSTGEPTLKLLNNLGNAYFTFFKEYRDYYRMSYYIDAKLMHSQVSEETDELCTRSSERIWGIVSGVAEKAQIEGLIRKEIIPVEIAVMLWANSDSLMRLMDQDQTRWKEEMGINLEELLKKSNRLLVEGMLTEKGKELVNQYVGLGPLEQKAEPE